MKLHVQKSAQGPVLAKGDTDCGLVDINGQKMAGCSYDIPDSTGVISAGGTYTDGGTVGAQYTASCGC